jgi:hypothetical protein
MAGNPLGSMVVELGLDSSSFGNGLAALFPRKSQSRHSFKLIFVSSPIQITKSTDHSVSFISISKPQS